MPVVCADATPQFTQESNVAATAAADNFLQIKVRLLWLFIDYSPRTNTSAIVRETDGRPFKQIARRRKSRGEDVLVSKRIKLVDLSVRIATVTPMALTSGRR